MQIMIFKVLGVSKTISVSQDTWRKLKDLIKEEKAEDFNHLINILLERSQQVQKSMFGVDADRQISFAQKEHEEITKDTHGT